MASKRPFCLMPWIHFHVGDRGMVKACCVANIPYGNINEESFESIWNGDSISSLQAKFLNGEADPRCAVCLNREKAGAKSIRQETFEKFPEIQVEEGMAPIYFDIRFSNVCNFRCRTCWHGASSKWFNDAKVLKRNLGQKAIIANIEDITAFIDEMAPALRDAKEIYFAGGEPLVTEAHYQLLDWLIKQKSFPRLRYNSNFSVVKFKQWDVFELWNEFPEIEVMASIDATGNLGEYIRKELNWNRFIENVHHLKQHEHIHFKLAPTVSLLNVMHLPDLYLECLDQGIISPGEIYINILERPFYYNIKALPQEMKSKVARKYEWFFNQVSDEVAGRYSEVIRFMHNEDLSNHWPQFIKETQLLDDLRNESFASVETCYTEFM